MAHMAPNRIRPDETQENLMDNKKGTSASGRGGKEIGLQDLDLTRGSAYKPAFSHISGFIYSHLSHPFLILR